MTYYYSIPTKPIFIIIIVKHRLTPRLNIVFFFKRGSVTYLANLSSDSKYQDKTRQLLLTFSDIFNLKS